MNMSSVLSMPMPQMSALNLRDKSGVPVRLDRWFWLSILIAAMVVIPRSWMISRAHSECVDAEYHLDHGLCVLRGEHQPLTFNDPPLGEAILSLPLYLSGCRALAPSNIGEMCARPLRRTVLYDQPLSPETLLSLVALWKAILFLPCAAVVFHWCRILYGLHAGWLGLALLLLEPTIAGHVPVAAIDSLGMEAAIIACFFAWRFVENPTPLRTIIAGLALSAALMIKHTSLALPPAILLMALLIWRGKPMMIRHRLNALAGLAMVTIVWLWPLSLFDFSVPREGGRTPGVQYDSGFSLHSHVLLPALSQNWPAGSYVGSLLEAGEHARDGHPAYLWGEHRNHGWWYYFGAVALYKVPIGIALVLLAAGVSLWWKRPRLPELGLLLPMLAGAILISTSGINIGFRHALPAYVMGLMLASRSAGAGAWKFVAWVGIALTATHGFFFHPDYLSYVNAPWTRPELAINDSNIDWGQGTRQVSRWLDSGAGAGRTIYLDDFDAFSGLAVARYIGDRVHHVGARESAPTRGLLIVSPAWIAGLYGKEEQYHQLRDVDPVDRIGHCLLVYDLDALHSPRHRR